MLRYTLAFIRHDGKILMINREKNPWQGAWNGVGGKLEPGESPEECVVREIGEETGVSIKRPVFRGIVTWNPDSEPVQGMYVFVADIRNMNGLSTPMGTREGILEWKSEEWVLSESNYGTVPTLHVFMKAVLDIDGHRPADYHCTFDHNRIIETEVRPLPVKIR